MKLADLKQMCEDLGIPEESISKSRNRIQKDGTRVKVSSMADYTKAIQHYYIEERKKNGTYDKSIEFMLHMESPMLALLFKDVRKESQEALWDDENKEWIFEEKIDGNRQILIWDHENKQFHFYSRNESLTDLLPIDYADKILIPDLIPGIMNNLQSFVLDCEVVPMHGDVHDERVVAKKQLNIVSSILQYLPEESKHIQETNPLKSIAFDCLYFDGEYLFDKPLRERQDYLYKIVQLLELAGFNISVVPTKPDDMTKKEFYNSIIDRGGEGVIAKNLNDTYDILGKRDGRWVKLKRSVQETLLHIGLADSFDGFLTGFTLGTPGTKNENKVGALIFSVYLTDDNNELLLDENGEPIIHEIAQISGISDDLRNMLTQYDEDGNVVMNPRFYNQVASIDGQDVSSQELRLMHAKFLGWRLDRSFDTCKVKKSTLENMVL